MAPVVGPRGGTQWIESAPTGETVQRGPTRQSQRPPHDPTASPTVSVSDKRVGKSEQKLRRWGKLSTTKEPGAQK